MLRLVFRPAAVKKQAATKRLKGWHTESDAIGPVVDYEAIGAESGIGPATALRNELQNIHAKVADMATTSIDPLDTLRMYVQAQQLQTELFSLAAKDAHVTALRSEMGAAYPTHTQTLKHMLDTKTAYNKGVQEVANKLRQSAVWQEKFAPFARVLVVDLETGLAWPPSREAFKAEQARCAVYVEEHRHVLAVLNAVCQYLDSSRRSDSGWKFGTFRLHLVSL